MRGFVADATDQVEVKNRHCRNNAMSTQFLKQEPKVNTRHENTETREQRAAGEPLVQEVSGQGGELGEERGLSWHFVRVLPHL